MADKQEKSVFEAGGTCHMCGRELYPGIGRYVVDIQVYAPYEILEINLEELAERDLDRELRDVLKELRRADPEEVEEKVFKAYSYVLCDRCREMYSSDPLGRSRIQ